jgi:hypothetical protein
MTLQAVLPTSPPPIHHIHITINNWIAHLSVTFGAALVLAVQLVVRSVEILLRVGESAIVDLLVLRFVWGCKKSWD